MTDVPAADPQVNAADASSGKGETLYEIRDLKKHFPLTSGILFRKQVGAVHAVSTIPHRGPAPAAVLTGAR